MRSFAPLLLVTALAAPVLARQQVPQEQVERIVAEGRDRSQVMAHLDHLTNEIGPRLTGSQRLIAACEWARDRFQSFGLANARLEKWGEVEVGFDRGVHTGAAKWLSADNGIVERKLTFGTNAWTVGTDGVKHGRAVLAPSDADLEGASPPSLAGAWVLTRGGVSSALRNACEKQGALGYVTRNPSDLILTGGNMSTKWERWAKLPQIRVLPDEWDEIAEQAEIGEGVQLTFDVQNRFQKGPVPVYNVLAELKGTEKPDELVIVGGHIDSWDGATGTTDNGTGVATTLEAARILCAIGAKPRRTIRFMLWSGEEQGLLGSRAYIRDHPEELPKVSAVLVHDGGTNYVSGIYGVESMLPVFEQVFAPVVALDPQMPFRIRRVNNLPGMIGSDHDSYVAKGVPGFFWDQSGRAVYRVTHHTQNDTFEAAIPEYQRHTSIVVAIGAYGLASWPTMLPRPAPASRASQPNPLRTPRRLGVEMAKPGLEITGFAEKSRGKDAGLRVGDLIVAIDGVKVATTTEFADALNSGGDDKKVAVVRDGKQVVVEVSFARQ